MIASLQRYHTWARIKRPVIFAVTLPSHEPKRDLRFFPTFS